MSAESTFYRRGFKEQPNLKDRTSERGIKGILNKISIPGFGGRNREAAQPAPEIVTEIQQSINQTPEPEPDPEEERLRLARIEKIKEERSVIREIKFGVDPKDYKTYLRYISDPDVKGHINPLPYIPDWDDPEDVHKAEMELNNYFSNIKHDSEGRRVGNPNEILPMTAVNQFGESVGFVTIRWKGDKHLNINSRVAGIERIFCDPKLQGHGIGKKMLINATNYAFYKYKGYGSGLGALEMRGWVMQDQIAGNTSRNTELFRKRGFKRLQGPNGEWTSTDRERYSICYKVEKDSWEYGDLGLLMEDQPVIIAQIDRPKNITDNEEFEITSPGLSN